MIQQSCPPHSPACCLASSGGLCSCGHLELWVRRPPGDHPPPAGICLISLGLLHLSALVRSTRLQNKDAKPLKCNNQALRIIWLILRFKDSQAATTAHQEQKHAPRRPTPPRGHSVSTARALLHTQSTSTGRARTVRIRRRVNGRLLMTPAGLEDRIAPQQK